MKKNYGSIKNPRRNCTLFGTVLRPSVFFWGLGRQFRISKEGSIVETSSVRASERSSTLERSKARSNAVTTTFGCRVHAHGLSDGHAIASNARHNDRSSCRTSESTLPESRQELTSVFLRSYDVSCSKSFVRAAADRKLASSPSQGAPKRGRS